jgi:methylenetetrahydrofolate dehydrogenase (NADP+)/methenyltetrahydrofolate cyclohydrolase
MEILNGKIVSQHIKNEIKSVVDNFILDGVRVPHLAAILVGNNGASETYVASKIKNCEEIGFKSSLIRLNENVVEQELIEAIIQLNNDDLVDGILVQLPLPAHFDEQKIINLINPNKDVDGFSPVSIGKMVLGMPTFIPATPYGVMLMLEHYNIETSGKHAVIIGRSNIVGRPMSILLNQSAKYGNCTVTVCHSRTKNIKEICLTADIIVAAIGIPEFVKSDMVKDGTVVIDVGITRVKDESKKSGFSIKGDVDFDDVSPKCSFISPVPGGVGLMTIAALLKNTLNAYIQQNKV